MFEHEIASLGRQGFTSGGIAIRLGLSPGYVRSVLSAELAAVSEASKPHFNALATDEDRREHRNAVDAAKKAAARKKAKAKQAKALLALQAAEAELRNLNA